VRPVDDCWHPVDNPRAREWWYYALLCDDGGVLRGRLWTRGDGVCGLDVSGHRVGRPTWEVRDRFDADAFHAQRDRLLVMVEASRLEQRGDVLELHLRRPGLALHLEARHEATWSGGPVHHRLDSAHGVLWTVPALRARASGSLARLGGPARPLSGTLFVDHVFADIVPTAGLLASYRGWTWGLVYAPGRTTLFVGIELRPDPVRLALVADADGACRLVRGTAAAPVVWRRGPAPRFVLREDGERTPIETERVWHRRRAGEPVPLRERLLARALRARTVVGVGRAGPARVFYETLSLL